MAASTRLISNRRDPRCDVISRGSFTVCDGSPQDADGANNGVVGTAPLDPSTYHVTETRAPAGYRPASATRDVVADPSKDARVVVKNRRSA